MAGRVADRAAGLATSLILGVARIAGETAPLLIVSGASTFFNNDPLHDPMNSLPLFIFTAVRSGEPQFIARGYGAAGAAAHARADPVRHRALPRREIARPKTRAATVHSTPDDQRRS